MLSSLEENMCPIQTREFRRRLKDFKSGLEITKSKDTKLTNYDNY